MGKSSLRSLFAKDSSGRKARTSRLRLSVDGLEKREVLASMYDVAWLGTLSPTDNFSVAQGINDLGQVVGESWIQDANGVPDVSVAFQWDSTAGMTSLGTAGGSSAYAWDINDNGLVSGKMLSGGTMATGGYYEWAAIWTDGVGQTIPGYGSIGMMSVAYGSNDNNIVVGNTDVQYPNGPAGTSAAFKYDGNTVTLLSGLGGRWSYGMDINNNDYVAGFADTGENPSGEPNVYMSRYHATIWAPDGTITDLGTFGTDSYAYKINATGQAVGSSIATDGFYHAFFYDGTQMIDIGTPDSNTQALSINDAGQVVGDSVNWLNSTAFLYEGGTTYDLNTLVIGLGSDTIMSANDINNLGQIVGYGMHNGRYEAYVLVPNGQGTPVSPPANGAPTAVIAGPYTLNEGNPLTLDASRSTDPDGDPLTYSWDINGDGTFGDAVGAAPVIAWNDLQTLGIASGNSYTISVSANDGHGHTVVASTSLTVISAPTGSSATVSSPIDGYQGVTGQVRTVQLGASGPLAELGFEFIVEWGDGTYDTLNGQSGITASHVYDSAGAFEVTVIAIDSDDVTSDPATLTLNIQRAEQQGSVLAIGGTQADDTIMLAAGSTVGTLVTPFGTFVTDQVMVYGGEGSDRVVVQGTDGNDTFGIAPDSVDVNGVAVQGTSVEMWTADGLAGDDVFTAIGTSLTITLQGGSGNDRFRMAAGSVLKGQVDGGAGSDVLDYGIYQSPVAVNLQNKAATGIAGFADVERFIGSNMVDTITGADSANTWTMTGYDAGTIAAVQFGSFENWVGGSGNDNFIIASAGGLYGLLDGGAGVNTLDYSGFSTGVVVNLTTGAATSLRSGVAKIANVFGGSGSDLLTGDGGDNILLGNAGNDVLDGGAGGNDVLVGGAGNDALTGSLGRNIMIGGIGADTMTGGAGEDVLIGGNTSFDVNLAALNSLIAEWKRTDLTYQQRADHLTGKVKGGANGTIYLTTKTVKDDKTADILTGGAGLDWFWGLTSEAKDRVTGERLN